MTDFRSELQILVQAYDEHGGRWPDHHVQALSQAVNAARAALAQPEPQGPTLDCDEIEVPVWHRGDDFYVYKEGYTTGWAAGVNAAADCWARPAIEPVPVAERLPGPEDCTVNPRDGQGQWCWGWVQWYDEIPYSGKWRMMRRDCLIDEASAWLPHHALPVPQQEADRG